jgi:multidrug efflux pump subunit AcrA (membrane-fusion protein)
MKKRTLIIIGIFAVIVSILLILIKASKKEAAVTFETVKVTKGYITSTVTAVGTIEETL